MAIYKKPSQGMVNQMTLEFPIWLQVIVAHKLQ